MESMQLNRALEKDDVRSRTSRLVVNYECKQSRDLPIVITAISLRLTTLVCIGSRWCIQLLDLRC